MFCAIMLSVNEISTVRRGRRLFENLGFTLGAGGCLIVKGKNGSGKTTLLRIIAGLAQSECGSVRWNNINISDIYATYSSSLQYVGHKPAIKPELSVRENLEFYAKLWGTEMLVEAAISYFKLEKFANVAAYKLSVGFKKRTSLARLVCCPADIWILDEPTANLDEETRKIMFNLVSVRCKEGGVALIATHDDIFDPLGHTIRLDDFGT